MNISENVTLFFAYWTPFALSALLHMCGYSIRVAATCTLDLTFWLTLAFGLNLNALEISLHLSHTSYLLTLMQKKNYHKCSADAYGHCKYKNSDEIMKNISLIYMDR
jgi:hypothetical protein